MRKNGQDILLQIFVLDIEYLKTYYKWNKRYIKYGIDGLKDRSKKPHNIQPGKVTKEIEEEILNLRITKSDL